MLSEHDYLFRLLCDLSLTGRWLFYIPQAKRSVMGRISEQENCLNIVPRKLAT